MSNKETLPVGIEWLGKAIDLLDECNLPLQSPNLEHATTLVKQARGVMYSTSQTMTMIAELLWPGGKLDEDWNGGDVCQDLARLLRQAGYGPHDIR